MRGLLWVIGDMKRMDIGFVTQGFELENDNTFTKNDNDNIYTENWKTITHSPIFH